MLRFLIELKQPDVPPRVALRNTAAVALPLVIGAAVGHLPVGLGISTGALNTMFADQPGPYAVRARRMLLTATAMAVSALAGFVIGAAPVGMVVAGAFWGFAGALLVALGSDAGRVGVVSIILLVVTSSTPKPLGEAVSAALLIFSGGLLQLLMAIAAWPLQRYKPERDALAQAYDEIGRAARERPPTTEPPPVTASMTDLHLMLRKATSAPRPANCWKWPPTRSPTSPTRCATKRRRRRRFQSWPISICGSWIWNAFHLLKCSAISSPSCAWRVCAASAVPCGRRRAMPRSPADKAKCGRSRPTRNCPPPCAPKAHTPHSAPT
jgi:hypothetical protein